MDDLINKFISKKLRKKGQDYQLSENSRVTAQDFGQLSTIASKIYQHLTTLSPRLKAGSTFNELVALLREMRNRDQTLSNEAVDEYTHINILEGFPLNKRASWNTILPWRPQISFDIDRLEVKVTLPQQKNWTLQSYPPRLSRIGMTFHLIVINRTDPKEKAATAHTTMVFENPPKEGKSLTTAMRPDLFKDSLIIVIGKAQYYLFNMQATKDGPSEHNRYNATDIMATFHVRNGTLLKNKPVAHKPFPLPRFDPSSGSEWE
ncbi:hypothetical protein [Sphingobacterium haloxyli]|uniref:Uncharacterized protein n=1 Tax=Sphingobacterium haloxyli TaxID=2100533 RepID=A0A2S9J7R1_9SPHI|nr:hypothetical protein [Sphingobacterium haloxyli]PRD48833.1 hypothetical protein C5745_02505 [Sphingobacterium haloxyli]